ncbi:type IVB secretion system protein IcmW [Neptunomonas phycophila]|uniref:type IVB secretion system protein IcmW n=1 Tax=Neptunomonas phycophila TaxID=1572645 RepID=UPI003518FCC2
MSIGSTSSIAQIKQQQIAEYWAEDPVLNDVLKQIEGYETWTERDEPVLTEMNESVLHVIDAIEKNAHRIASTDISAEKLAEMSKSMLLILGFMPARQALFYLDSFRRYEAFFVHIGIHLNNSPPLQDYTKTLLGRAITLQQRALQLSVNSDRNFNLLSQAVERVLNRD